MNYGFIIDNRKCIGCHACSTACKSENEVPLSVNRTWVKYVETGEYPNSTRHFQVTRCNHCANPPCARICPVSAMYQRDDGIVEFNPNACIGCKACLQACPYDAIYIDPETHAASKCHYCAHRIDVGLEPACVVVCPEHAIIAGDMDDPASEISHMLAHQKVTVRKPEQGTAPKLFYINGNDVSLHPTATERTPETYMWADVIPLHQKETGGQGDAAAGFTLSPPHLRTPSQHQHNVHQPQGHPDRGPIQIGQGRMAEQMVQVAYNAQHFVPWHWPVPAYLVTKGIGAGIFMLLSLGWGLNLFAYSAAAALVGGFCSLLLIAITTGLLVYDLEKPELFFTILTRPQWRSWLTRGAFILIGFTTVAGAWWLLEALVYANVIDGGGINWLLATLLWVGFPLALFVAIYTAFLFGQAEGRDLWQSSLLPFHLVVQAFMVGAGALLFLDLFISMPTDMTQCLLITLATTVILDLFVTFAGEFGMPHASEAAAIAAHDIRHGKYRDYFWKGGILIGHVVPLVLLGIGALVTVLSPLLAAVAGVAAIAGLYYFEYAFVMAPQDVPNS